MRIHLHMMTLIPHTISNIYLAHRYTTLIKQTSHIERPRMCKNVIYDASDVVLVRLMAYNNLFKRFVIKAVVYIIIVGFFPRREAVPLSVFYLIFGGRDICTLIVTSQRPLNRIFLQQHYTLKYDITCRRV